MTVVVLLMVLVLVLVVLAVLVLVRVVVVVVVVEVVVLWVLLVFSEQLVLLALLTVMVSWRLLLNRLNRHTTPAKSGTHARTFASTASTGPVWSVTVKTVRCVEMQMADTDNTHFVLSFASSSPLTPSMSSPRRYMPREIHELRFPSK